MNAEAPDDFRVIDHGQLAGRLAGVVPHVVASGVMVNYAELRTQLGLMANQPLHVLADIDGTVLGEDETMIAPQIQAFIADQRRQGAISSFNLASNSTCSGKQRFGEQIAADCRVFTALRERGKLYRKPHARYFTHIEEQCDFSQDPVLMIGDKCLRDVLGARRMNWFSMLVRPRGSRHPVMDRYLLRPIDMLALQVGAWAVGNEIMQYL